MRISSPSQAPAASSALSTPNALEAVLQERDGLLVFPVGLHDHALHARADHAEHVLGKPHDLELRIARLALVLPNVIELPVACGLGLRGLAQFAHLRADGVLQAFHALARSAH